MKKNALIGILFLIILVLLYFQVKNKKGESKSSSDSDGFITKQYLPEIENRDSLDSIALSLLQNNINFNKYLEEIAAAPNWRYINRDSANCFYKIYHDRKEVHKNSSDSRVTGLNPALDKTEAIFIPLDTFLEKVALHYVNDIDFTQPNTWKGKGYLVYPVHYGKNGYKKGANIVNKHMTSVVIQFVQEESASLGWDTKDNSTYNFGGLKPPKKFISTADTLNFNIPAGLICN